MPIAVAFAIPNIGATGAGQIVGASSYTDSAVSVQQRTLVGWPTAIAIEPARNGCRINKGTGGARWIIAGIRGMNPVRDGKPICGSYAEA